MDMGRTDCRHETAEEHTGLIFNLLLSMCFFSCLFMTLFILIASHHICNEFRAANFLASVSAVPKHPFLSFIYIAVLLLVLTVSYCVRELCRNKHIILITFAADIIAAGLVGLILDFNYNGFILWVLSNLLLYTLKERKKIISIIVICTGMLLYLCTDFGLLSIVFDLYNVRDYISFYDGKAVTIYLYGLYDFCQIGTIVCFIVFCTATLVSKQNSLHKINDLYLQLYVSNTNLQAAHREIEKYVFEQAKNIEIQERNRLAREIHDTVGHTLAAIAAGLDACITLMQVNPPRLPDQLRIVSDIAREGIREIRRSVNHLRPDALERLSLESAIRQLIRNTESATGIRVCFSASVEVFDFDEDEELTIFRLIQESITNAIKHSQADTITLEIHRADNGVRILIRDNGIGCSDIQPGFGLSHMQSRIEMLHGAIEFRSDRGFSVEAVIPIRSEKSD